MANFSQSIGDWVGILTIATMGVAVFKALVINPLSKAIQKLSDSIENFKNESSLAHEKLYERINDNDRRLDEHDRRLDRHHEKIKTLYKTGGN